MQIVISRRVEKMEVSKIKYLYRLSSLFWKGRNRRKEMMNSRQNLSLLNHLLDSTGFCCDSVISCQCLQSQYVAMNGHDFIELPREIRETGICYLYIFRNSLQKIQELVKGKGGIERESSHLR